MPAPTTSTSTSSGGAAGTSAAVNVTVRNSQTYAVTLSGREENPVNTAASSGRAASPSSWSQSRGSRRAGLLLRKVTVRR